jgi:hypothetical protein
MNELTNGSAVSRVTVSISNGCRVACQGMWGNSSQPFSTGDGRSPSSPWPPRRAALPALQPPRPAGRMPIRPAASIWRPSDWMTRVHATFNGRRCPAGKVPSSAIAAPTRGTFVRLMSKRGGGERRHDNPHRLCTAGAAAKPHRHWVFHRGVIEKPRHSGRISNDDSFCRAERASTVH